MGEQAIVDRTKELRTVLQKWADIGIVMRLGHELIFAIEKDYATPSPIFMERGGKWAELEKWRVEQEMTDEHLTDWIRANTRHRTAYDYLAPCAAKARDAVSTILADLPCTTSARVHVEAAFKGFEGNYRRYGDGDPGAWDVHDSPPLEAAIIEPFQVVYRQLWADVRQDINSWSTGTAPVSGSIRTRSVWRGSASELAFLLTELVEAGYLVPPPIGKKTGKDGNRAAIAGAILNAFDIRKDNGEGDPVSPDYFRSLLRPDSPDRGTFAKLFTIRARNAVK